MATNFNNADLLFHYTTFAALQGIIESRALHCTNILHLNDSWEWNYLQRVANDVMAREVSGEDDKDHRIWPALRSNPKTYPHAEAVYKCVLKLWEPDSEAQNTFCFSLSKNGDQLSQWRAYADNCRGICIGFDRNLLPKQLIEVKYDFDEAVKLIKEEFCSLKTVDARCDKIVENIREYQTTWKWQKFEEEMECRIVIKRNSNDVKFYADQRGIIPYIAEKFDLKSIKLFRLGPLVDFSLVKPGLHEFLKAHYKHPPKVEPSNIPLRW